MTSLQWIMIATEQQLGFLKALHYVAPALVLAYFLITTIISACTLQNLKACGTGPRKVLVSLVSLVVISFLVESCMLLADTLIGDSCHSSTDGNVSTFPRATNLEDKAPPSCLLIAS